MTVLGILINVPILIVGIWILTLNIKAELRQSNFYR